MQTISISLAAPGMVLAREIRSSNEPNGRVLCGKGVTLTESLISRVRQMGIESVSVEGHPIKMEGERTAADMLAALDQRFCRVTDDPLMMRLKEIYRRQILRSMGEETGG
jgi:hypothetical protein